MSLAERLSQLRPSMTRAQLEAILGPEETNRALDMLRNPQRHTGVSVNFSHADEAVDSVTYTAQFNFPADVPVCGLRIGMSVSEMQAALPETRLHDGETGQPNQHGFVHYSARPCPPGTAVDAVVKAGTIHTIRLSRANMSEVLAARAQSEAERRAGAERHATLADRWKTIDDPDEMLLAWAEHCAPWDDATPEPSIAFARWLIATPDPDAWHVVATNWNWDNGRAPLLWIARQKQCDIATALELFFLGEPTSYFRHGLDRTSVPAGDGREDYDFLIEIRRRLADGFYTRSELAYDGNQHMPAVDRGLKSPQDKARAELFFPSQAHAVISGRNLAASDNPVIRKCHEMLAQIA